MKFTRIEELERSSITHGDEIVIGSISHIVRYEYLDYVGNSNDTIFTNLGMLNKKWLLAQVLYGYVRTGGEFPTVNHADFGALKRMAIFLMKSMMIKEDMGGSSWTGLMGAYRLDLEGAKSLIANIEDRYDVLIEKLSGKKSAKKQAPISSVKIIHSIDDLKDYTLRNGDYVIIGANKFEVCDGERLKNTTAGDNHITFINLNIDEKTISKPIYGYPNQTYSQWPYSKKEDFEGLTNMVRFLYKATFLSACPGNEVAFKSYVTSYRDYPEHLVKGIESYYNRLTTKREQSMKITNINQLDNYVLKIGDTIEFNSGISYQFNSRNEVKLVKGQDIYRYLGDAISKSGSHLSYWNLEGGTNDSFGNSGGFPSNNTKDINPEQLTKTVRDIFKMLTLKESNPKVLDEIASVLGMTEGSTKIFLKSLEEEYNKIKFTQVITNNNLKTKTNGQIIIVPAKVATVNRGQNITGHAVPGRRRQTTITVGHLSFYKIIGAG